jgi:hypothetical protein
MNSKHWWFTIYMLLFYFVSTAQNSLLKSIKVKSIDWSIRNPYDVPCSDFEKSYQTWAYCVKVVSDSLILDTFNNELQRCTVNKSPKSFNVKAKFFLSYDNHQKDEVLCISQFYDLQLNGSFISKDENLVTIIKQILKH